MLDILRGCENEYGHAMNMNLRWIKRGWLLAAVVVCSCFSSVWAQSGEQAQGLVSVDDQVVTTAQAAVQKMGMEMMKGNFSYSHQRMYLRWKMRLAKRHGGVEKLDLALAKGVQQQTKMGISVTAFQAHRPTSFFSVWRAKKRDPKTREIIKDATGREVIVEHWLAVVPTVTRVRIPDKKIAGKSYVLEEQSYTLAISEKGQNDWYLMTGMKPTIQDLRSMFPTLPPEEKDLMLPPSSAREIK